MKNFLNLKNVALAMCATIALGTMTSCSDEDKPTPVPPVPTVAGIYIVNSGNQSGKLPGSLTAYNYETGMTAQQAFYAKNGLELGDTPNSAIEYGSNLYVAVTESNLIWVLDAETLEIKETIRPEGNSSSPRFLAGYKGNVYATMQSGHLARIDTLSMKIDKTIEVGPNPERLAVQYNSGKIYVPNSDGYNYLTYANSSVSVVDIATMTEEKKINVGPNPTVVATNGADVYVLSMGDYSPAHPATVKKIIGDEEVKDVCPGTLMAVNTSHLYVINAAYGTSPSDFTYKIYSTADESLIGDMVNQRVDYPSAIVVDDARNEILILSYTLSAEGKAQYREPGYGYLYDNNGNFQKRIEAGVGPIDAVFRHSFQY